MSQRARRLCAGAVVAAAAGLSACNGSPVAPGAQPILYQVGGPTGNFPTIQAAINAAPAGEVVGVNAGTYSERLVISKPVKLRGTRAILDGAAVSDGTGIGIHVTNAANGELTGFTVQNYERGIVLENASHWKVDGNEVKNSMAKTGPLVVGVSPWEAIMLIGSSNNEISNNFAHDNGHDGLMVTAGSGGNSIHDNRFTDNGSQTPTRVGWGIDLFSGSGNSSNQVTANQILRNHWGILINAGSTDATANIIRTNTVHANGRAGITILGPASGNTVDSNDATGNGLLNIAPTLVFDLFAVSPAANVWRNNQGTANFTQSAQAQSGAMTAIAMEAFGLGGCLHGLR